MVTRFALFRGGAAAIVVAVLLCFSPAKTNAQVMELTSLETAASDEIPGRPNGIFFPDLYFTDVIFASERERESSPYWVHTREEHESINRLISNQTSLLLNNDILAFYGHPRSQMMGILGRYSIEDLDRKLTELAREYEAVSGGRKVIKAFYIIFGTVWPQGEIGYLGEDMLKRYVEYGLQNNVLVFIDHQIGRYDPIDSLKRMLPWLKYPNVHLALDPEWRTAKPMQEIGTVTASEINRAQQVMQDYIIENNIPGERMLVIHQFNWRMISNRDNVDSTFRRVRLVHCADGFGPPNVKRSSYASNAQAVNMPIKGFKLFYNFNIPGAGYDHPLLTPQEVYGLNPRPYIIMYQ
jgi:hypothetical protein